MQQAGFLGFFIGPPRSSGFGNLDFLMIYSRFCCAQGEAAEDSSGMQGPENWD